MPQSNPPPDPFEVPGGYELVVAGAGTNINSLNLVCTASGDPTYTETGVDFKMAKTQLS